MKKKLFFLAVAAVALASCSNDETIASQANSEANEISFRPLTTGITRAADADLSTNGFRVTAFQTGGTSTTYFSNVDFTLDNGTYTSANKYYWPSGYNLDFYAWSPGSLSSDYSSIVVEPGTTIASQPDLVYGKATNWGKISGEGTHDGSNGVTINFRHAESKVVVKLKNSNPNLYFTVKDVKIGYLASKATYTYTTGNSGSTETQNSGNLSNSDWATTSGFETNGVYQLANAASTSYNGAATQVGDEMILIPQTLTAATAYSSADENSAFNGAYILVEYKAQNVNGSGAYVVGGAESYEKAIWPLTAITWTPGFKYTYTVDLAGGGYYEKNHDTNADLDPILEGSEIMFATVTVDGWDNADVLIVNAGNTQTVNVPNKYASNPYKIIVNGLTSSATVTASGTNNFTASPTITSSPVPASGIVEISGALTANTNSEVTSVVTITESGAHSSTTTINIVQAAE